MDIIILNIKCEKKMNKILLYVALCSNLSNISGNNVNYRTLGNFNVERANLQDLEENKNAVNLANDFMTTINNKKCKALSNNQEGFSGIFIDKNNKLHISHTSNSVMDYSNLIISLNKENVKTSIDVVQFSLSELLSVKEFLDNNFNEIIFEISLSQEKNRIIVRIKKDEYKDLIINELKDKLPIFDCKMIEFEIKNDIPIACGNSISSGAKIIYKTGWWIFAKEHWNGSVGFNAVDASGKKGVVTCYHVAPIGNEMRDSNNNLVGYANSGAISSSIDASFIPFDDQSNWNNVNSIYGQSYKLNGYSTAYEGAKVFLFGCATGKSYGTIKSIYSSTNMSYLTETHYLTDLIQTDCTISSGDSGGPLTTANDGTYQNIYGLNIGADSSYSYTCKIENILSSLNVSIY